MVQKESQGKAEPSCSAVEKMTNTYVYFMQTVSHQSSSSSFIFLALYIGWVGGKKKRNYNSLSLHLMLMDVHRLFSETLTRHKKDTSFITSIEGYETE